MRDDPSPTQASPEGVETVVERRRSARTPFVVRVQYSTVDAFFSEFTRDINEGGLFIETDQPAPLDSRVQVRFSLPGTERPVKASARVVHVSTGEGPEPPGMGIEFEELDESARVSVDQLVQQLRTRRS